MTKFNETDAGAAFIASGASRETSRDVMEAIAFFARDEAEAEAIWNGDFPRGLDFLDIWENATGNGARDTDLTWGDGGDSWADEFLA